MNIDILQAQQSDLPAILQLQKDCYLSEAEIYNDFKIPPLTQSLESLEDVFKNSIILKVETDGEIIASIRGYAVDRTAYIGKLIVKNDQQNKGIGRLLMDAIETSFKTVTGLNCLQVLRAKRIFIFIVKWVTGNLNEKL